MFGSSKSPRRLAIREHRPDSNVMRWNELKCNGTFPSLGIAALFFLLTTAILLMRQDVLPYRLGQSLRYDVNSRVDFFYKSKDLLAEKRQEARTRAPRVYHSTNTASSVDIWQPLREELLALPDNVGHLTYEELPPHLKDAFDHGALTMLQKASRSQYTTEVTAYINELRRANLVILPADQREIDRDGIDRIILLPGNVAQNVETTFAAPADPLLKSRVADLANDRFRSALGAAIAKLTLAAVAPTYTLDQEQTEYARNTAADNVTDRDATLHFLPNQTIVRAGGVIDPNSWQILQAENQAYTATMRGSFWMNAGGTALLALLLTISISAYIAHFQPKVIRNQARGLSIAGLLLSMLLLAQLAGMGTAQIYWFAIVPTLLVGIILSIAYEQRFAVGLASMHALMVTIGLDQRVGFLLVIWVGVICTCFQLSDIRSRSKLIEVGGVAALAMMVATAAWGMLSLETWLYIANNCLYAGAAGLSSGFIVLGILPFIEKLFRITTSMTLLELADASHPLLRRLSVEASGTYSHSLKVAELSHAAAEAIGANALLCRVAAYYHDVGKMNKPDYFVENQMAGQPNRHIHLTPSVSFLIIKNHVADGVEMAREYNLPRSIFPFIQQHHGTTLVEYFYRAAVNQKEQRGDDAGVSDTEYRYPGPKPRSKEVGILMLADCVESATRSMVEPTPAGIERLVHDLASRRLLDGQFDDCELTLRDLDRIEKSFVKTLLSIYHGRIAYPSTAGLTGQSTAHSAANAGVATEGAGNMKINPA